MSNPTIFVQRFWQEFKPGPDGQLVPVDMVAYGPIGSLDKSLTIDKVSRLSKVGGGSNRSNPAVAMAQSRWDIIRPRYEAWKAGQEAPVSGTPLGAWNAVTSEQADVFKMRGVKTVEDVAALTDAHINSIPVPHLRELVRTAHAFLELQDASRFATELLKKDEQISEAKDTIAALTERMDQMAELLARMTAPQAAQNPAVPPQSAATPEAIAVALSAAGPDQVAGDV